MGCFQSTSKQNETKAPQPPPNFGKKANINIQDYMFCQQESNLCIKPPGSINGEQFIIEDNNQCDIYILDHIAAMNVDNCCNCRIVTGPVSGSIFLRDCKDCIVIIACQQLRLRNCHNMKILLFSTTGPIIESSSSIVFGCYNFNYFDLERNITNTSNSTIETHRSVTSGLNIYNNLWYDVYNFTPDSGSNHYLTLSQLDESMVYSQSIFDDFKTSTMSPPQSNPNSKNGSKGKRPSRSHGNWAYKLLALNFNEYSDILSQLYKYNNKIQYILEEQLQIVTPISNTIRPVVPMTCGIEQCYGLQYQKGSSLTPNPHRSNRLYYGLLIIPLQYESLIHDSIFHQWVTCNSHNNGNTSEHREMDEYLVETIANNTNINTGNTNGNSVTHNNVDIKNAILRTVIKSINAHQVECIEKLCVSVNDAQKQKQFALLKQKLASESVLFVSCISNGDTMKQLISETRNTNLNNVSTQANAAVCIENQEYILITEKSKVEQMSKYLYELWKDKDQQ